MDIPTVPVPSVFGRIGPILPFATDYQTYYAAINGSGNVVGSIQFFSGTAAAIATKVGAVGQPLFATDTHQLVIGDGTNPYSVLAVRANAIDAVATIGGDGSGNVVIAETTLKITGGQVQIGAGTPHFPDGTFLVYGSGAKYSIESTTPTVISRFAAKSAGAAFLFGYISFFASDTDSVLSIVATDLGPVSIEMHTQTGEIILPYNGTVLDDGSGNMKVNASIGCGGHAPTATSPLNIGSLPTSASGLVSGDVWRNGTALAVVP